MTSTPFQASTAQLTCQLKLRRSLSPSLLLLRGRGPTALDEAAPEEKPSGIHSSQHIPREHASELW